MPDAGPWIAGASAIGDLLGGIFGLHHKPFGLNEGQHALDTLQKSAIPEGMGATSDALSYFRSLLFGSPTAQAAAVAPQVNAASGQSEQQRKQISSEGTARGGGLNSLLQQTGEIPEKATIDTLTTLQPEAARSTAAIGQNLTSTGARSAEAETNNALNQRSQDLEMIQTLMSIFRPRSSGGSGPPVPTPGVPEYPSGGGDDDAMGGIFK